MNLIADLLFFAAALALGYAATLAVAAIVYGVISIGWIVKKPAGNARMQEIAAAIQAGAKDFVVKPFQPSRVLEAVQRVLG